MKLNLFAKAFFALSLCLAAPAKAEYVYLGVGSGVIDTEAKLASLQVSSHADAMTSLLSSYGLKGRLEWSLFAMEGKGASTKRSSVFGITPVARYAPKNGAFFLEIGLGPYWFDERMLSESEGVGTKFNFGSLLGLGLGFGEKSEFEIGYRLMHFSNAGMSSYNPGVNIHQIRLGARF